MKKNDVARFTGQSLVATAGALSSLFLGGAAGSIGAGVSAVAAGKIMMDTVMNHSLRKTGKRTIDNLFTGYEPTAVGKGVILGGFGLVTGGNLYDQFQDTYKEQGLINSGDLGVQSLPSTRADMMGYNRMVPTNAMDMSATGDLVFALHKLRGGY